MNSRTFWVVPHLMHVFHSEAAARKAAIISLDLASGKPLKVGEVIEVREALSELDERHRDQG